jgi:hypothetical protein
MYYVNYDDAYNIRYREQQKGKLARDAVTEKYILGMRILMLSFENSIRSIIGPNNGGIEEYSDDFREMSANAAASAVSALAEILPKFVDGGPAETD